MFHNHRPVIVGDSLESQRLVKYTASPMTVIRGEVSNVGWIGQEAILVHVMGNTTWNRGRLH